MKRAVVVMTAVFLALVGLDAMSQKVKVCKNLATGEVFVVERNMPCPFPTTEI